MKQKGENENETGLLEFLEDIIGTRRYVPLIDKLSKSIEDLGEIKASKMNRVKISKNEINQLEDTKDQSLKYYHKEKERLQKIAKKNKKLKAIENEYKKEIEQLKNEKNKNILETMEKLNTIPIYEINDLVNVILNSINIFKSTQNDIKTSVDKLVNISQTQNEKLKEENKKYKFKK